MECSVAPRVRVEYHRARLDLQERVGDEFKQTNWVSGSCADSDFMWRDDGVRRAGRSGEEWRSDETRHGGKPGAR